MHGAPSWREPAGRHLPVAASYLHAGNHVRELGSTVQIDAAQDIWGHWSVAVSGNWRIVFRFEAGEAMDVDLVDYH